MQPSCFVFVLLFCLFYYMISSWSSPVASTSTTGTTTSFSLSHRVVGIWIGCVSIFFSFFFLTQFCFVLSWHFIERMWYENNKYSFFSAFYHHCISFCERMFFFILKMCRQFYLFFASNHVFLFIIEQKEWWAHNVDDDGGGGSFKKDVGLNCIKIVRHDILMI